METKHIFISHDWAKNNLYEDLCNLLDNRNYFSWKDYSVPKGDPIDSNDDRIILESLIEQIKHASCVIVIASMDVAYSYWIEKEIKVSNYLHKPIIGIKPRGQERIPKIVSENAEIVGWNTESVVNAIREYTS